MKRIIPESLDQLYEEFLGITKNPHLKINSKIHKNIETLKGIGSWVRGISDNEGNLFIAENFNIVHTDIIDFLHKQNLLSIDADWFRGDKPGMGTFKNCIAWQRIEKTNEFRIGESYNDYCINRDFKEMNILKNKVQKKFPQFKFYLYK